jgi:hypothetical protein
MQTYVEELSGAVEMVLSESNVDRNRLFALANSEGSIHAVNYQLQARGDRFKGLVLTGAPGRTVGELARSQLLDQMNSIHNAKGATGLFIKLVNRIRPLPDTDITMKHYDEAISKFVASEPVRPDPSLPKGIKKLLLSLTTPTNQPFSRELWSYDLTRHISKLDEPILVVIGKKDLQVDWKIDGKALEEATSRKTQVSFAYPENANHVLKHEDKPKEKLNARYVSSHYNAPDAKLDEEAAEGIFRWLNERARSVG